MNALTGQFGEAMARNGGGQARPAQRRARRGNVERIDYVGELAACGGRELAGVLSLASGIGGDYFLWLGALGW